MGATGVGQRQALGDDRVDLAATKQLEQRAEVSRNQSWWWMRSFWIR